MYNDIMEIVSGLVSVVGTIYAIFSILKMGVRDVWFAKTLGGMDNADKEKLIQRRQARTGTIMVIYGWIINSLFKFISIDRRDYFMYILIIISITTVVLILLSKLLNEIFFEDYTNYERKINTKDK